MSNYTKSTNFATKDNLTPGDPLKVVRGTEIDTEYNNIATAIATKTDNASAAITGGSITGITDLAVADGGTGASTAAGGLNNLLPTQTGNANKYLQTDGTNATWDAVTLSTADITGTLPVANGGTGVTSSTGTGSVVLSNSPTLVTPVLGTPASGVATNITGLPISTGVSGLGSGVATFLGTPSSANLASAVTDETGSGALVFANSPTLVTPALGTPSALVGTNITGTASGLTAGNVTTNANLTGAVTSVGNATSLGSFSSANLLGALTDETGTGSAVFATSPTLVTPILGTPTSATLTNATGLPISTGVSGLGTGVATFLATPSSDNLRSALTDETGTGSAVFATSPTLVTPILGTPTSATLTNATGLPLTTGVTGTLPTANGGTGQTSFTSGGVVYASNATTFAATSALQFNGTELGVGVTPIVGTPVAIQASTGNTAIRLVGTSSSATSNAGIYWYDSNNTTFNGYIGNFSTSFDFYNQRNTPIVFSTNATEISRFTSRGLGIGTTSITSKLTIGTDSFTSAASNTTGMYTGANGLVVLSDGLFLATRAGVDRFAVDTSGNVGIGTSSPSVKLNVVSTSGGSVVDTLRLSNNASDAGTGSRISFHTADAVFNAIDGVRVGGGSGGRLAFSTMSTGGSLTERVRISEDGTLRTFSTISVGNVAPSSSGAGITFPATQSASSDANTLDDYEEGTWTPAMFTGSGSSVTYASQVGKYTKIGRQVFCQGSFQIDSAATWGSTTHARLTGLPFGINISQGNAISFTYGGDYALNSIFQLGDITGALSTDSGATEVYLQRGQFGNTSTVFVQVSNLNTTGFVSFTLQYTTNT